MVAVAEHQTQTEQFVILQDIEDQINEVTIDIVQIQYKQILLFLLVNCIGEEDFFGTNFLQVQRNILREQTNVIDDLLCNDIFSVDVSI